jgi:hypothetical protein
MKIKYLFLIIIFTVFTTTLKYVVILNEFNLLITGGIVNSLVAGTFFIFGIIISSTFLEFRETHKSPGEIANHLESLIEDVKFSSHKNTKKLIKNYNDCVENFVDNLISWSERKVASKIIFENINNFSNFATELEKNDFPANYITRIRNEIFNIRKIFIRLDYVRDVNIAKILEITSLSFSLVTIFTVIFTRFENIYTGLWTVSMISIFFSSIYFIIKILDNPIENKMIDFLTIKKIIR